MVFNRHRGYQQLELSPDRQKRNIYNTTANSVEPKQGEVILFSSGLQHLVEKNKSAQPRYSIAFNSFIKGKLGSYRDVSELTI
jgi:ectoine hydroxylase-related dioxygenase (phytanoyl-CoA dioxygenase family)